MTVVEQAKELLKADYDAVYEAGKKAEYDKFWDAFQNNGERVDYYYGFYGKGFNVDNFYPKYDIKMEGDNARAFYAWESEKQNFNLMKRLKECGVVLDTSKATNLSYLFAYGKTSGIPTVDLNSINPNSYQPVQALFAHCWYLVTIEKIIMNENTPIVNWFVNCVTLINLTIEGTIGQNGFNVSDCTKLTQASLLSILKALSLDITETKTITFATVHQTIIETDEECKPYWEAAKAAGWSFVYA